MKIVLTGGGSAGHVTPNIALFPSLKQIFDNIYYIGSKNGIEKEIISTQIDLEYYGITTTKFVRRSIFKNLLIPIKLMQGINESKKLLKELSPDVIFSKGGYVSVPISIAAKKLNIPLVCHESDLTLGLANKIISRSAFCTCTSFEETANRVKNGVFTGSAMRCDLLLANADNTYKKYNLNPQIPIITIVGGSLGANTINKCVESILDSLTNEFQIIHLTGKGKTVNYKHPSYHQEEFTNKIGEIFAASTMVISRAGSNTIFELATLNKPMLLIPLKKGNSRGDQVDNAKYFQRLGIAKVLFEEKLTPDSLLKNIYETIKDAQILRHNLSSSKLQNGTENIIKQIKKALVTSKTQNTKH